MFEELVALTGIEPDHCQFSPVQFKLSSCVFGPVGTPSVVDLGLRAAGVVCRWSVSSKRVLIAEKLDQYDSGQAIPEANQA